MRTSLTPRSSSVCDTLDEHSFRLDDSGNGDHVVPAHDERPRLACGTGDLRVDEHVLDLLRSPGEPIAGTPGSYLKAWELRGDPPLAPAHLAGESDGRLLDPDIVVFADRGQAAAEVESLRPGRRGEQLVERRRQALGESPQIAAGARMQLAQARQDLLADQPALRVAVRVVGTEVDPLCTAVRLGLLAPHGEEGTPDAVLPPRLDPLRRAARDEPVEDRLDLVRSRVPRRPQPVGRERVAEPAPVVLRRPAGGVHHLCAETLRAETRVLVGGGSAQAVVHMQCRNAIAERPQHMPETGRVGTPGDEAGHGSTRRDQLLLPNEPLDRVWQHDHRVDSRGIAGLRAGTDISLMGTFFQAWRRRQAQQQAAEWTQEQVEARHAVEELPDVLRERHAARSTRCSRDETKRSPAPSKISTTC